MEIVPQIDPAFHKAVVQALKHNLIVSKEVSLKDCLIHHPYVLS